MVHLISIALYNWREREKGIPRMCLRYFGEPRVNLAERDMDYHGFP